MLDNCSNEVFEIIHIQGDTRPDLLEYTHYGPDRVTAENLTGISIVMEVKSLTDNVLLFQRSTASGTIIIIPLQGNVRVLCPLVTEQNTWNWAQATYSIKYSYADGTTQTWVEDASFTLK